MDIFQQAQIIVEGTSIEDKLYPIKYESLTEIKDISHIKKPGRNKRIEFSQKQLKFPSKKRLESVEGKALALHFFANHELLAIEMMSMAILKYPIKGPEGDSFRRGIISTIKDEQKHFQLYCRRMNELGINFGDCPVNDYFWRQLDHCKSIESFYALMALTFESANLDFADYYRNIFLEFEDDKTADIMSIVLADEIRHVTIGWNYLNKSKHQNMWKYYQSLLPEKITPARSKGIQFNTELRKQAGMDSDFINEVKNYKSNFKVTNRKSWKDE